VIAELNKAIGLFQEGLSILTKVVEAQGINPGPEVDRVGHIAFLHLKAAKEKGAALTIAESLEIRRPFYGSSIQGSAALFGREISNHILYRNVPNGTPRSINQPVALTDEGKRRAKKYAEVHGLAA